MADVCLILRKARGKSEEVTSNSIFAFSPAAQTPLCPPPHSVLRLKPASPNAKDAAVNGERK